MTGGIWLFADSWSNAGTGRLSGERNIRRCGPVATHIICVVIGMVEADYNSNPLRSWRGCFLPPTENLC